MAAGDAGGSISHAAARTVIVSPSRRAAARAPCGARRRPCACTAARARVIRDAAARRAGRGGVKRWRSTPTAAMPSASPRSRASMRGAARRAWVAPHTEPPGPCRRPGPKDGRPRCAGALGGPKGLGFRARGAARAGRHAGAHNRVGACARGCSSLIQLSEGGGRAHKAPPRGLVPGSARLPAAGPALALGARDQPHASCAATSLQPHRFSSYSAKPPPPARQGSSTPQRRQGWGAVLRARPHAWGARPRGAAHLGARRAGARRRGCGAQGAREPQ